MRDERPNPLVSHSLDQPSSVRHSGCPNLTGVSGQKVGPKFTGLAPEGAFEVDMTMTMKSLSWWNAIRFFRSSRRRSLFQKRVTRDEISQLFAEELGYEARPARNA